MIFQNRREGGRLLAERLSAYRDAPDAVVLALPRGGVPVGYEVAQYLHLPLDVLVVRKLGVPDQEELAMGAIASGGAIFLDSRLIHDLRISDANVQAVIGREQEELQRREEMYRGAENKLDVANKTLIVVDDGIATGASMLAAVQALRSNSPRKIVVAAPVAAYGTCARMSSVADECVFVSAPEHFRAVGQWYRNFKQTSDQEVRMLLERAHRPPSPNSAA